MRISTYYESPYRSKKQTAELVDAKETTLPRLIARLHGKIHPTLRLPQPPPEKAQSQNDEPGGSSNGGLHGERIHGPGPDHPVNLNVRSHEAAHGPPHDDPRADLSAPFGVRVQEVRVQRHGGNHDAGDLSGEEDGEDQVVVGVAEGEAEDEDRHGHDGGREPDDDQAGFGLDVAGVPAHVVAADEVVEPVAQYRADDGADDGGEVEEAWNQRLRRPLLALRDSGESRGLGRTEVVRCEFVDASQPNRDGYVDADDPRKVEEIIEGAQEYGKFRDCNNRTH